MPKLRYTKAQLKYFREMGKLGGLARAKLSPEELSAIARKAVQAREAKKLKDKIII